MGVREGGQFSLFVVTLTYSDKVSFLLHTLLRQRKRNEKGGEQAQEKSLIGEAG